MACFNVMGVVVNHRSKNSSKIQGILTKYGCLIKVRLGLHETGDSCSEEGLIILQLDGGKEEIEAFEAELNEIEGVHAKRMEICS